MFWFMAGLVAVASAGALALPLLHRRDRPVADAAAHDRAVYRDQLAEVERDLNRGLLSEREAEAVRLEIRRRILRTDRDRDGVPRKPAGGTAALAIALLLLVPTGALGLYLLTGTPGMPDMPLAGRPQSGPASAAGGPAVGAGPTAEQMRAAQEMDPAARAEMIAGMVAGLEARLESEPGDFDGWMQLGRSRLVMGAPEAAREAYAQAAALRPDSLPAASALAAAILQADGTPVPVSEEARAAILRVLEIDPEESSALFLMGSAAGAAQDWPAALDWFTRLRAALSPADPRAEVVDQIVQQLRQRLDGDGPDSSVPAGGTD